MRPISDILRDVILGLESIGESPYWPWVDFDSKSPLGLYASSPTGHPELPVCWSPDLEVDTGTLIDAAQARGIFVTAVPGDPLSEKPGCVSAENLFKSPRQASTAVGPTFREKVVLALAGVLGVDTEE